MKRIAAAVAASVLVAGTAAVVAGNVGGHEHVDRSLAGGIVGPDAPTVLGAPDGSVLAAGLVTADDCTELGDTMRTLAAAHVGVHDGVAFAAEATDRASGVAVAESGGDAEAANDMALGATGTADDGTNVQEAGVDEPDLVERVGDLTVVGSQGVLRVVTLDATGAPVARGEVLLGEWGEVELFAVGSDRAVALVRDGAPLVRPVPEGGTAPDEATVVPAWSTTSVVLVDLADPDEPLVLSRLDLEGWLVDARAVDGVLRIAVRGDGPQVDVHLDEREVLPGFDEATATEAEWRAWERAWEEAHHRRTLDGLARVEGSDWQPHVRVTGSNGSSTVEPLVPCDRIALPTSFAGLGTLTVAVVDATGDTLAVDDATSLVAAGEQLYATADRLVVATTRWEPCCEEGPAPDVLPEPPVEPSFDEGDDAPGEQAASAELLTMVDAVTPIVPGSWGPGGATDLHVFDVTGSAVEHVASGSVEGWLLGQFAMSLHDGVLRVATTARDPRAGRTESAITTFRVERGELVRLGGVDGLGPGEEIHAVRFMGEVAHVVTFRRTDPLYVVDLADPAAPQVLGELKIEGYSAHLHPLGPTRLLGVGQDADPATGATRGVQVSTFDVTDPTDPRRIDVDVVPDSASEVEWDHHALTVTADGTVLVPFESWSPTDDRGRSGVLVYRVGDDGTLTDVGVLDAGSRWQLRPRRTVDLGEVLLTVGDQGVTTWDAISFQPLGSITFPEPAPAEAEPHLREP